MIFFIFHICSNSNTMQLPEIFFEMCLNSKNLGNTHFMYMFSRPLSGGNDSYFIGLVSRWNEIEVEVLWIGPDTAEASNFRPV